MMERNDVLDMASAIVRRMALTTLEPLRMGETVEITEPKLVPRDSDGACIVMNIRDDGVVVVLVPLPKYRYAVYLRIPRASLRKISVETYNDRVTP